MQQTILPLIPSGSTKINEIVNVYREEERWTYFLGQYPVYSHNAKDHQMFKLVTAQLIESGACRQVDVLNTFGVSKSSVIRSQNKLRKGGSEYFFKPRQRPRGGTKLTPEILKKAQGLLDQGASRRDISEELNIKYDTLRKAVNDGRLQESNNFEYATTKSHRNEIDAAVAKGMGTACTRVEERVLASLGRSEGAPIHFETCLDVPKGGVLCALPALLGNGLFEGVKHILGKVKGYYTVFHILLILAFMSLCRIKVVEGLRGQAPGEFGKIMGLDRIPEVRCLRNKMDDLSAGDAAEQWAAHLSSYWMEKEPGAVGTLYIDGHVRVYHGGLTKPPRRYVSRERLCLRGTTDYWVNDAVGLPFFMVEKPIDPGLLNTLRDDIVPRLLKDIPKQPSEKELEINPLLSRFVLVFDREGYSPAFFSEMWEKHRIGCITYHKHPGESWPVEWFREYKVTMPRGEVVEIFLAEMGSLVGSGKNTIWMREVRKLTDSGHQTSLISTAYEAPHTKLAAHMFTRWCQENFFRYMMKHFAIDLLQEYGVEEFPATEKVINPTWRELDRLRNSLQNKLRYRRARFAEMTMHPETEDNEEKYDKWVKKKADLLEQIEQYEHQLGDLKMKLKETLKHITWENLEEKDKFHRLLPGRKRLMDTVRMIAYRAETTMMGLLTNQTVDSAAARQLLQDLFVTDADIIPEPEKGQLRVRVHNGSRPAVNRELALLFEILNKTEVNYPGTDLRVSYEIRA
jgi:transposase